MSCFACTCVEHPCFPTRRGSPLAEPEPCEKIEHDEMRCEAPLLNKLHWSTPWHLLRPNLCARARSRRSHILRGRNITRLLVGCCHDTGAAFPCSNKSRCPCRAPDAT